MKNIRTYLFLILIGCSLSSQAQYWESIHGDTTTNIYSDIYLSPDGSIYSAGYTNDPVTEQPNMWLTKSDPNGNLLWDQTYIFNNSGSAAEKTLIQPNENLLVIGNTRWQAARHGLAWEINSAGQTVNAFDNFPNDHLIFDAIFSTNDELIVGGRAEFSSSISDSVFIGKLNAEYSAFEWIHYFGEGWVINGSSVLQLSNGSFALSGYITNLIGELNTFLILVNADGSLASEKVIPTGDQTITYSCAEYNGSLWYTGFTELGQGNNDDIFLLETSLNGDSLNYWIDSQPNTQQGRSITITDNGSIFIVGYNKNGADPFNLKLQRWDTNGNILWDRTIQSLTDQVGNDIESVGDSLIIVGGYINDLFNGDANGYLLHPSTDGFWYSAQAIGNVFKDQNLDCLNNQETNLDQWLVQVQGKLNRWTLTDSLGNYSFQLDTGDYNIVVFPPNDYWDPCSFNNTITISSPTDTIFTEHGIQAAIDCPLLTVDIGTPLLRRCFQNTYHVKACNEGTATAENARVEIEFDSLFNIDNASIPWSNVQGQVYTFELGNLEALVCIEFTVSITVSCDAELGQTHCVEAHAFPDSICDPISNLWDLSSLELEANCLGDSIEFIITNVGVGNTSQPQPYIIIEDHIMYLEGEVELDAGSDTVITVPSTGGMIRMELEQSVGHPGNSNPSVSIEGCGGFPFSLGYVIQYSYNDANPFVDIDCRENIGSYDPNDKQAFPSGYRDEHYIEATDKIEYLIRFQNTGTDTAFTVVIKDTLSQHLDISTLEFGATSHPARWSFGSGNELEIRFENILLPDSTTNEIASHGYAKFTIYPKSDLNPGIIIYNQAGIYFDFNEAIITNETYHTIGIDYLIIDLIDGQNNPEVPLNALEYYPNPFLEHIYFELEDMPKGQLTFQLMDLQGKIIHQQEINDSRFSYRHIDRSPGIYFFQLLHEGATVSTGKIICQN